MLEYIINIGLTSIGYIVFALVVAFVIPYLIKSNKILDMFDIDIPHTKIGTGFRSIGFLIAFIGLGIGFFSPSNTYKHEAVNVEQIQNRINHTKKNVPTTAVVDLSLQSNLSKTDSKKDFSDLVNYKKNHLDREEPTKD